MRLRLASGPAIGKSPWRPGRCDPIVRIGWPPTRRDRWGALPHGASDELADILRTTPPRRTLALMPKYKCWDALDADEEDAREVAAFDEEMAAAEYAENQDDRGGDERAEERDVMVRAEDGTLYRVTVTMSWEPSYSGTSHRVEQEGESS